MLEFIIMDWELLQNIRGVTKLWINRPRNLWNPIFFLQKNGNEMKEKLKRP